MPPDLNWAPVNEQPQVRYASIGSGNFATMLAVMVLVVVLSSIGASKGVVIGPVITDGAFFLFPPPSTHPVPHGIRVSTM